MKETTLQLCRVKAFFCLKQRYAILLLLLGILKMAQAQAGTNPPQDSSLLTINLFNAPLEKAFAIIKQQTPYRIIYDNSLLKNANPVTVNVNKEPLQKVLSLLFRSQPFDYRIIEQSIILTPKNSKPVTPGKEASNVIAPASDTLITGVVLADSSLMPLAGATVQLKGSKISVITGNNGKFSIRIPQSDATLVISYIGYSTKNIPVNGNLQFPLNVLLKEMPKEMEEVIIMNTGYEALPKERATGSFAQVDNKLLNQQVGVNIIDRLKGVASSVLFEKKNDGPSFTIRGLSTINGPKEPLIILDNYPYEGDINNINPNDIENITILKDAAAASIWGTRAGNGVVVITTKKGKFNQPLKVEFNTNFIVTQKPDLFYLPLMSSPEYIDVEQMLFNNGFYNSQINSPYHSALSPAVEVFLKKRQGIFSEQEALSKLSDLKSVDIRNEYKKYFYRNAMNQQYALNLRGGNDNITYLLSGGYDRGVSNLDAPHSRINLRSENTYRPVKGLLLNFGLLYTNSSSKSGKPGYGDVTIGAKPIPYLSFADATGNPLAIAKTYRQSFIDTAGGGKLLDWNYYPLEEYKYNTSETSLTDLLGKLGLNYRIIPGIDIDIKYQYQKQQTTATTLASLQSYYTRDLINTYSELNYSTGNIKYGIPLGGILGKSISTVEAQNIRGQINFNRKFGNHEVTSLIGSEIRQIKTNTDHLSAFGYDPDILTTEIVDAANPYRNFVTGSYDYLNSGGVSFSAKTNRFVSFFGNTSYIFKERYILTGSVRKDASNLFGKATNDKWTPLWSVGARWNISNEPFFKCKLLPELKLRATYGYSGNVDQSKSAVTVMAFSGNADYTNLPYGVVTQYRNSELRWERVGMFNLGVDFSLRNKVLSGSLEYYRKKGVDLFGPSPIDYTAGLGYFSIIKNVADMKASGFDLSLISNNISNHIFRWSTNFLLSYNLAKTDKYYLGTGISSSSFVNSGNSITPIPGQPLYTLISYQSPGLNTQGNPQGMLNKQLSTDYYAIANDTSRSNLSYSGTSVPKCFGSIINNFSWQGLSVSINISYKLSYYFRRPFLSYDQLFNNGIGHREFTDCWKHTGDELITNVPALVYPNNSQRDIFYGMSQVTVEKGDHIRLQYINVSYNLPENILKKCRLKDFQLYLNASNIGILWRANKKDIDPDLPNGLPLQKSYAVGIRSNF